MSKPPARRDAGFTLMEVLVAFLVASLVLTAALEATASGLRQMRAAQEVRIATMHAQSALARLGADIPIEPGLRQWRTPDGFTVRIATSALPSAAGSAVMPFAATVSVGSDDGEPFATLSTIALAAPPS